MAVALAIGAIAACGAGGEPGDGVILVRDGAGRAVRLEAPARRVVSMIPALTDWAIAMDAGDRLVARTDYDHHPALGGLPSVGGGLDPSVEWLAALGPDLVLAWPDAPSRSLVSRLEHLGIPVYTAPSQTVEQALAAALDLGTLLGAEEEAAAAVARVGAGLARVSATVDGRPRPGVLFLIGLDPLMAAGPGSFVDQLVERAGGRNVLAHLSSPWPHLSLEEVVRIAPDVVILASPGGEGLATSLRSRPGWREVPAVRARRVHAVDPDFVNRPGPELHEAAARLSALIHPDLP
jgi:iron complex transport system substrate-binding protein